MAVQPCSLFAYREPCWGSAYVVQAAGHRCYREHAADLHRGVFLCQRPPAKWSEAAQLIPIRKHMLKIPYGVAVLAKVLVDAGTLTLRKSWMGIRKNRRQLLSLSSGHVTGQEMALGDDHADVHHFWGQLNTATCSSSRNR